MPPDRNIGICRENGGGGNRTRGLDLSGPKICSAHLRDGTPCSYPASPFGSNLDLCWRHRRSVEREFYQDFLDRQEPGWGWVYFITRADRPGYVKIGFSKNVVKRVQGLGADLLFAYPNATREDERDFHVQFAAYRVDGEWFRVAGALRTFIAERLQAEKKATA